MYNCLKHFLTAVAITILSVNQQVKCKCDDDNFITICNDIKDLENNPDVEDYTELLIGPISAANINPSPFNLLQVPIYELKSLTGLTISRFVNDLQSIQGSCTYGGSLKSIKFHGNNFKHLPTDSIPFMTLDLLSFKSNNIETISNDALTRWSYFVKVLDLSRNKIDVLEGLPGNPSRRTSVMKKIILSHNSLTHIDDNAFPTSVEFLYLDHNKLRYMSSEVMDKLGRLKELRLSHNQFRTVPEGVKMLSKIQAIDFSHNKVESIDFKKPFIDLKSLESLDLSDNLIKGVSNLKAILTSPKHRQLVLSLAFNKISELSNDTVENLTLSDQVLYFFGNRWDCRFWDRVAPVLINYQDDCDKTFFSSGKVPYCFQYRDATYLNMGEVNQDERNFYDTIRRNAESVGCSLKVKRLDSLHRAYVQCNA